MPSPPDYTAMSFRLGVGGCGVVVPSGPQGQPRQCSTPATRCGLILHRMKGKPAETWLAFACEQHASGLTAARDLLDRDRAVLEQWRSEQQREYSAQQPWRRPQPLARGADALQLVERARRWVEAAAGSAR
jgi:hypothetical protein